MNYKFAIMLAASLMATSACGVVDLPGTGGESAEVSVVNAEPALGSEADDGADLTGLADDDTAAGADDGSTTDGAGADAGTGADGAGSDGAATGAGPSGPELIEQAGLDRVSLVGDEDRMSTNPDSLTRGWGYLTVHGAVTTARLDDTTAEPGNKLAVVDYQLLGGEGGNFFDEAFRLRADGETFSPLFGINEIVDPGGVINHRVVFEIPAGATAITLEGGAPEGTNDGFTAVYDIALEPAPEGAGALPAATGQATAAGIELLSTEALMSTNPDSPVRGAGTLTINGATAMPKIEEQGATPGFTFAVIDYQLLGTNGGNFFHQAFRLEADGEWYGPVSRINEIVDIGGVINDRVVFQIPADTETMVLEAGVPEQWADGYRTRYRIDLAPTSGDDAEPAASTVDPEAEASEIRLVADEATMSTNPDSPVRGAGNLTIDGARSTVKIEENGARDGFKFVIVEFQLLGTDGGNFFEHAFRMQADGEWYAPSTRINEIVDPGVVFNGQLVFEVPIEATMLVLEGGMPTGSPDGFTTRYEIRLG